MLEEEAERRYGPDGGGNAVKCKLVGLTWLLYSRIHTAGVTSIRPVQDQASQDIGIDGGGVL